MKLEMFGGPKSGGWSGHMEYEHGVDPKLAACPFCGGSHEDLEVSNSHTPAANVECTSCGAQGPMSSNCSLWKRSMSKRAATELFRGAFYEAIKLWNERYKKPRRDDDE